MDGVGRVVEGKCRQLYLNNNKIVFLKKNLVNGNLCGSDMEVSGVVSF